MSKMGRVAQPQFLSFNQCHDVFPDDQVVSMVGHNDNHRLSREISHDPQLTLTFKPPYSARRSITKDVDGASGTPPLTMGTVTIAVHAPVVEVVDDIKLNGREKVNKIHLLTSQSRLLHHALQRS